MGQSSALPTPPIASVALEVEAKEKLLKGGHRRMGEVLSIFLEDINFRGRVQSQILDSARFLVGYKSTELISTNSTL